VEPDLRATAVELRNSRKRLGWKVAFVGRALRPISRGSWLKNSPVGHKARPTSNCFKKEGYGLTQRQWTSGRVGAMREGENAPGLSVVALAKSARRVPPHSTASIRLSEAAHGTVRASCRRQGHSQWVRHPAVCSGLVGCRSLLASDSGRPLRCRTLIAGKQTPTHGGSPRGQACIN
jgi:hypothetical protein